MAFVMEDTTESVVNIKVVGIGGGGNNVVNRLMEAGITSAEMVAVNTDRQALTKIQATHKFQIGEKQTSGKGAGSNPEIGRKSMEESRQEMAKLLEGTDMVFISAGMGGGTGTGAAPIVADIAREMGVLTIGIVTKPFHFEGPHRMRQAESGIEELRGKVDSLIIIPNERLKLVSTERISFANGFKIADDVLKQAVQSISDLINSAQLINLDFADVSAVMKDAGYAHIGVGQSSGISKAEESSTQAIKSPLLETTINGARGVIINITGDHEMSLDEVELASNLVKGAVHHDANIIFGAAIDESMQDEMRVIVIATGFEETPKGNAEQSSFFTAQGNDSQVKPAADNSVEEPSPFPPVANETPDQESEEDPFESIFKIFNKK
ncbi:MAG: cell division protein FtsZ [Oscillospiraceae bacterium]|nr:cell division protein FtsZ [Oscillospiraceae bacterium]